MAKAKKNEGGRERYRFAIPDVNPDPGPPLSNGGNFNNDAWDKFLGTLGGHLPGEITVEKLQAIDSSLDFLIVNFNSIAASEYKTVESFLGDVDKVLDQASRSDNPRVQVMARIMKVKVALLRVGLAQGYLAPADVAQARAQAEKLAKKFGSGGTGPTVDETAEPR